jgi:hypothetical protein
LRASFKAHAVSGEELSRIADMGEGLHPKEFQTEKWFLIIREPGEAAFMIPTRLFFSERNLQLALFQFDTVPIVRGDYASSLFFVSTENSLIY